MFTNLTSEQIRKKYHFDKHIWEGWRIRDFIDCLEPTLDRMMEYGMTYAEPVLKSKDEIKTWVKSRLPYTTKALKEVSKYFIDKYNNMPVASWTNSDGLEKLIL